MSKSQKLAEAYVDLTVKGWPGFNQGMNRARAETQKTGRAFDNVRIVGERTWNRVGSVVRRFISTLKQLARQTDEGKASVENFENAQRSLVDSFLSIIDLDVPRLFAVMAAGLRALTVDTMENQHLLLSWKKTWLELAEAVAIFTGNTDKAIKIAFQWNATQKQIDELQNQMTRKDIKESEKRIEQARKERQKKTAEFMSLEDVWKEAQQRITERQSGIMNKVAEPAPGPGNRRDLAVPAGRRPGEKNLNAPEKFLNTPNLTDNERHGIITDLIDRLEQSNDPEDRKRALKYQEEQTKLLKDIRDEAKKSKGVFPR